MTPVLRQICSEKKRGTTTLHPTCWYYVYINTVFQMAPGSYLLTRSPPIRIPSAHPPVRLSARPLACPLARLARLSTLLPARPPAKPPTRPTDIEFKCKMARSQKHSKQSTSPRPCRILPAPADRPPAQDRQASQTHPLPSTLSQDCLKISPFPHPPKSPHPTDRRRI